MNNNMPRTPLSTHLSRSAKETEIRIRNIFSGPKKRPPLPFLILMFSVCIFCGNIVSCQMAEPEPPDVSEPISSSQEDLPDPPEQKPKAEVREYSETLENIVDLDGDGLMDTATAVVRYDLQDENGSTITVTAVLGRGETVERQWTEEEYYLSIDSFSAGKITSPDRDALTLDLAIFGSNYGAAKVYILELVGGELTECYQCDRSGEEPFVTGTYLESREDSPLCDVRIPVLVDKWHNPEYYTLSWNGTGWDLVGDGYFTDAETITVTGGRVLTLALRGRVTDEQFGPHLIYDQIQVFDGDMMFNPNKLLQTITPEDIPADDRFPDKIFIADRSPCVWIQDVSFDGAEDFAVLCDSTKNQGCRWFRWNQGKEQFEYGFSLAGELETVPQGQKLIETCYAEDFDTLVYNVYGFNNRGWLILESSWDTLAAAQDACKEDF